MQLPDFKPDNHFNNNDDLIVYLHGKVNENFIIFRRDDFDFYYPSSSKTTNASKDLEDYLKYLYLHHTMVFTGFSFVDEYFFAALINIYNEIKKSDEIAKLMNPYYESKINKIKHYAFLKKVDYGSLNKDLLKNKYIPSDENFIKARNLVQYYDKLSKLKKINIEVVSYDEHIDWQKCFDDLYLNISNKVKI